MTIERARAVTHFKPWGVADLQPWSEASGKAQAIGELSYERADPVAVPTALLLKLLFTSEPLSIQVHPDDAYARAMGLPNGKSEAWYVLRASPGAKVAVGLTSTVTAEELRAAIDDGSIASLADWQQVLAKDVVDVPAGTVHAVGAGLIIAEIQQRSDVTFRIFDQGRERPLHIEQALAIAARTKSHAPPRPSKLSVERTLLLANSHFVLEQVTLEANSVWSIDAERETWLLVLSGDGIAASLSMGQGDALFAQTDNINLAAGSGGVECLVAYTGTGGVLPTLLQRIAPFCKRHSLTHENDGSKRIGACL